MKSIKYQVTSIKRNKGFTLIELLVVISILGVLTTLVVSNVGGARERARDAKRKSDLKEIQNALQLYKQDQTTSVYPQALPTLVATDKYIKNLPDDPLPDLDYYYTSTDNDTDYRLKACLENVSDPQGSEDSAEIENGLEGSLSICSSEIKFELSAP
jgi:type II secretion system protein G